MTLVPKLALSIAFPVLTLCHWGPGAVSSGRRKRGDLKEPDLGRRVECKACTLMVTDRHANPTGVNYLLQGPAAQYQRNSKGKEEERE